MLPSPTLDFSRHLSRPAAAILALAVACWSFSASAHDPAQHESHAAASAAPAPAGEASFIAENDAAMDKMMKDMMVKPTGDVDRDFVAMMVPHHQGAIDMAVAVLKYGRNDQLKRLAQEIIVTQQQEIAAMRLAIGEPLPPSAPAPTQAASSPTAGQQ
jgi:uncharacterized protein (DUF305 family)